MAQYEIADVETAMNKVADYQEALYLTLQSGLRRIVAGAAIDEMLEKRVEFGPQLLEAAAGELEQFGLKLIKVDVKDIMLPGEVKKMFNQIVKARKEGAAALEKARGETAALRNLANAAKMMEDHPSLLQLRLLQQVGESSGNTIVVGLPPGTPVVKSAGPRPAQREGESETQ
jgi:regulator of protease activity HflC (stomatin/prohibitin superfamily)